MADSRVGSRDWNRRGRFASIRKSTAPDVDFPARLAPPRLKNKFPRPGPGHRHSPLELRSLLPAAAAKNILLVEDDQPSRDLYRSALQRSGYTVVTAEDGMAALRSIGSAVPQLIVLDMMLPKLSGRDVLRELRANPETRHVPVIIITGTDVRNLAERAGILVLQKPFELAVLVKAVDAAVRRASQIETAGRAPVKTALDGSL